MHIIVVYFHLAQQRLDIVDEPVHAGESVVSGVAGEVEHQMVDAHAFESVDVIGDLRGVACEQTALTVRILRALHRCTS